MDINHTLKKQNRKIGRKNMLIKKIIVSAVLVMTIIVSSILVSTRFTFAESKNQTEQIVANKMYKSIVVNHGETLDSISEKYISDEYSSKEKYLKEVISINSLKNEKINAGDHLVVPYYTYSVVLNVSFETASK